MKSAQGANLSFISDDALIRKIGGRDEAALGILYHRYYSRLYRFISRMTGCTGSPEEAINDTMYVVWNKADTFKTGNKLSTWIFGIAYNKALKSLKQGRKGLFVYGKTLTDYDVKDSAMYIQQMETGLWLAAALAQLSPKHRMTVELSYYYGMSYKDVAEVMDCSENTVKTRMFYARKKLRVILPQLTERSASAGEQYENE